MKKLVCLFLAVILLMSVSLALAEGVPSPSVHDITQTPAVFFGGDHIKAPEVFRNSWGMSFSFSDTPAWETRTLADGSEVNIMVLAAVPSDGEYKVPMTAKLYFVDGKLAAAVQEITMPEGYDPSAFRENVTYVMGSGPVPLDLAKFGKAAELLGEDAHLENGQDAWPYSVYATAEGSMAETPETISAVMTLYADGNTVYAAEFPAPKADGKTAAGKDLTEMEGYDKLTEEEKNAVQLYADFLQQQQDQTLAQYIDFLVKKHQ